MIAQGRLDLLRRCDEQGRVGRDEVKRRLEVVDREQIGEVRGVAVSRGRGRGELPMLAGKLRGRRELDPLGLSE